MTNSFIGNLALPWSTGSINDNHFLHKLRNEITTASATWEVAG